MAAWFGFFSASRRRRALDIEIREGWRVTGICVSAGSVMVRNERGDSLHAAAGVLAAGAWSTEIAVSEPMLPPMPPAFPVKGHLTGYQLEPGSLGPISAPWPYLPAATVQWLGHMESATTLSASV